MAVTVALTNLRSTLLAHPLMLGTIAPGATRTLSIKRVNADDYQDGYTALSALGVVITENGVVRSGGRVVTGTATLTTEHSVVIDATAPFTITLADAVTSGTGFQLYLLLRSSLGVAAVGTLTLAGNAANTQTVTIGSKVYTFQTVLTNVDGNVFIGASASASIDNLIAAINLGAGSGTTYAAATTLHPTVTASAGVGDTMTATAKTAGTAGNAIATTETLASGSWGGGVLAGGDAAGNITIAAAGANTVLGGATTTMTAEGAVLRLVVSGTTWVAQ